MQIVLLSDTHSYFDYRLQEHCRNADEIWHAGDIGSEEIVTRLESMGKVTRIVYGNIDDARVRSMTKEDLIFDVEGVRVFMTHIGGRPPSYPARVSKIIQEEKVDVFICGHSHICLAGKNQKQGNLHLNPGAAGTHGFHKVRTLMRFQIQKGKITNLEVVELGPRAQRISEEI
jgi:putative phosphoesterase